jgi:hypothetical protein
MGLVALSARCACLLGQNFSRGMQVTEADRQKNDEWHAVLKGL